MRRLFLFLGLLLLGHPGGVWGQSGFARALLYNGQGRLVGMAVLSATADGVTLSLHVQGLPPGRHGLHLHGRGDCRGAGFKSAGGHLNPFARKHGLMNPEGHHLGDLPNLIVGPEGTAAVSFLVPLATLSPGPASLLGPEGSALVIHAGADDQRTDPSGSSGARIACGVIEWVGER